MKVIALSLFYVCLSISAADIIQPTCDPLAVPKAGGYVTDNSFNLYSTAVYSCEPGYTLNGPKTRQCLSMPSPFEPAAIWEPQLNQLTTCIKDTVKKECGHLPVPKDGSYATNDSFNLFSTAVYSCKPGYTLNGPKSRQCLRSHTPFMPFPIWEPQFDQNTTCVKDAEMAESHGETIEIFDPSEEEVHTWDLETHEEEDMDTNEQSFAAPPPAMLLSASDDLNKPQDNSVSEDFYEPFPPMDELCSMTDEIPPSYKCLSTVTETGSIRWYVDENIGDCVIVQLCGDDYDEIAINGLFHTRKECQLRCLL